MFQHQPTLSGTHINVRPLAKEDEPQLSLVASDPLIWAQHPVTNRHTKLEFSKFFAEALASGGALLVTDAQTDTVIGSSRYFGYDKTLSEIEIGWTFLARSHWGGLYNGELKTLMLEHAFKYVETVVFYIDPTNNRSQKSVEKIGAVREPQLDDKGRVIFRINSAQYQLANSSARVN